MGRVASVCDLHRVPCGSPEHLDGFLRVLETNKLLAMDFWGIMGGVGAIQDAVATRGASGAAPAESMSSEQLESHTLEAIVRVVCGMTIAETLTLGSSVRRSVEELTALIAGEDTSFPAGSGALARAEVTQADSVRDHASDHDNDLGRSPISDPYPAAERYPTSDQVRMNDHGNGNGNGAKPISRREERTAQSASGNRVAVEENIQEPTDFSAWSRVLSTDWTAHEAQAAVRGKRPVVAEQLPNAFYGDRDLRRLLFQGERPKVIEATRANLWETLRARIKRPAWLAEPKRFIPALVALGLVMTVGGLVMKAREMGLLDQVGTSVRGTWNELARQEQVQSNPATDSAPSTRSSGAATVHRPRPDGGTIKLLANADSGGSTDAAGPANRLTSAANAAPAAPPESVAVTTDAPLEVLPEVMKANLIRSPSPVVTRLDKGNGFVVMRAIISKSGSVESLRLVEGDSVLGIVATGAVKTWRYRPYLVNGLPVTVSTTITVAVKVDP